MPAFRDGFTGVIYELGPTWLDAVGRHIASDLSDDLKKTEGTAADRAAHYWSETYYEQLFPLRFGLELQEGLYQCKKLFEGEPGQKIDLEAQAARPLRDRFLDQAHLPPLWLAAKEEESTELLADRLLTQATLANLLLRQHQVEAGLLHDVRLACLIYPLLDKLSATWSPPPQVRAIATFLDGNSETLPETLPTELMAAVRDLNGFTGETVGVGQVAVQRIKQYVFETPGLNEIRGASTLLDALTERAKALVQQALGPEVVLRAAGSTLLFLAPTEAEAAKYVEQIQRAFYQATGTAFMTGAASAVTVTDLLNRYEPALRTLRQSQEHSRATGSQPIYETLPFEAHCYLCKVRPAEGWEQLPGEAEPSPLCRVCKTKREVGRPESEKKIMQIFEWLPQATANTLGVAGIDPKDYIARSLGPDDDEDGLVPKKVRRSLLATVYGDGNNFGAFVQQINSLALGRQWTQRVEKSSRAAAALALSRATQQTAQDRGWRPQQTPSLTKLPFQVLALGGDDLSLFAWAPVGIRFACDFISLTDLEFQVGAGDRLAEQSITYSLGALMTDHKAAVRRTVQFTEDELLTWAKQALRDEPTTDPPSPPPPGNIATLLADTLEQIPDDLELYRERMYRQRGAIDLLLTLRPYTAAELAWLLTEAHALRADSGPFHRLVAAFVQASPMQALLHFIYQTARLPRDNEEHWLKRLNDGKRELPASLTDLKFPATTQKSLGERRPFGVVASSEEQKKRSVWFTPLWDLLELVKILK